VEDCPHKPILSMLAFLDKDVSEGPLLLLLVMSPSAVVVAAARADGEFAAAAADRAPKPSLETRAGVCVGGRPQFTSLLDIGLCIVIMIVS